MAKKQEKKQQRRTYSISVERSLELSRQALNLSEELGRTVSKQEVLEALIFVLTDRDVYQKIIKFISQEHLKN